MAARSDSREARHDCSGRGPWWVEFGYPPFEVGPDGLPRPGQVTRYYRRLKRRPDGKRWTQADLARALGVTERYVNLMEHRDEGFDSFSRRRFLAEVLAIPPLLLGLADLPNSGGARTVLRQAPAVISRPAFDVEQASRRLVALNHKGDRSTAGPDLPVIQTTLGALYEALPFAKGDQPRLKRLLVGYHTLAGSVLRDEQQPQRALEHLNKAVGWASSLQQETLLAFALYRRMTALIEFGEIEQALQDVQRVRRLLPQLPADLRVALLLRGGLAQAQTVEARQHPAGVLAQLDEAAAWLSEALANAGGSDYHLPLSRERFQLDRAAVLLALNWPQEALGSLPMRQLSGMTRANVYADLLAAEAYARLGEYEQAAVLGLEAIPLARSIQSQVNLERGRRLMERLAASPFGSAPEVARLRLRLNQPGRGRGRTL